jgi:Xaa-Pro aminopeptidase
MSEYVGAYAQRLAWLTGFGGSAGTAAVLTNKAAMFVDGRYTLQVREQVDGRLYEYVSVPDQCRFLPGWLRTHPKAQRSGLIRGCTASPGSMPPTVLCATRAPNWSRWRATRSTRSGPISRSPRSPRRWSTRPNTPVNRAKPSAAMWPNGWRPRLDAAVISALDSSPGCSTSAGPTWSAHPVALSFVIAHADGTAELFIAEEKVTPELRAHLGNAVTVRPREAFVPQLQALAGKKVAVDPERSVQAVFGALEGAGREGGRADRSDRAAQGPARTRSSRPATAPPRPATARRSPSSSTG